MLHKFTQKCAQSSSHGHIPGHISLHGCLLIYLLSTPLKNNSPNYTTLHLIPPTLLEIFALSLTNILPSLIKLHLYPKPVTITFFTFPVSGLTLIPQQLPVPLLPLSFTPNLTTVILFTINSLSLNYPISSRSRTLLLVLSLKLLSIVISLLSYALSTCSESVNASNTSSSLLPTKLLQLPNLHTFIPSSLFSVRIVLALHLSLLLLGHQYHPLLKLLIAPFGVLHRVSGSNSFISSSTLFWYQFFHFRLTYSFTHHFFF